MSKDLLPNQFNTIQKKLDKLGEVIHEGSPAIKQRFLDLVAAVQRYRDANTDDGK